MKFSAIIALAAAMLVSVSAPVLAESSQQNRMKDCNTQAKGKAGDVRKTFMKSCLSGDTAAPATTPAAAPAAAPAKAEKAPAAAPALSKSGKPLTAQQMKMKDCNAEAKGMKGDERKKFMSGCLKK
jgi:hypothetical protein